MRLNSASAKSRPLTYLRIAQSSRLRDDYDWIFRAINAGKDIFISDRTPQCFRSMAKFTGV
jgi:hypothetical protein